MVFSPDEKLIVVGAPSGAVTLWDLASGRVIQRLQGLRGRVTSLAYASDGKHLLTGDEFGNLLWWDARTYVLLGKLLEGQLGSLTSLSAGPNPRQMVSAGVDGMLRLWDLEAAAGLQTVPGGESAKLPNVTNVTFEPRPGSARLLASYADGSFRLWDLEALPPLSPKLLENQIAQPKEPYGKDPAAFSPDGKTVAAGGDEQQLRLWDANSGRLISPQTQVLNDTRDLVYSADGSRVLTAYLSGGFVRRWSSVKGQLVDTVPLVNHGAGFTSLAFAPQGRYLAAGDAQGFVRLWDLATGNVSPPQKANRTRDNPRAWSEENTGLRITAVAFSADGSRFVSGGANGTLQLWSTKPMKALGHLMQGHRKEVISVAFSPDGKSMVSSSYDNSVRLWDVATGLPIGVLFQNEDEGVGGVGYSADGRFVVAATKKDGLLAWPGAARWPELLCGKLTRNMSHQQWNDWISPEIDYRKQCPSLPVSN